MPHANESTSKASKSSYGTHTATSTISVRQNCVALVCVRAYVVGDSANAMCSMYGSRALVYSSIGCGSNVVGHVVDMLGRCAVRMLPGIFLVLVRVFVVMANKTIRGLVVLGSSVRYEDAEIREARSVHYHTTLYYDTLILWTGVYTPSRER